MDPSIPSILLLAVILVLAVVGIFLGVQGAKKRRQGFEQAALELGMQFFAEGDAELLKQVEMFDLFRRGHARKMTNLLKGLRQRNEVAVFDYRYTVGSGKSQSTHMQTVFAAKLEEEIFTAGFTLRPENLFDKIGEMLKVKDIDFPEREQFSKLYLLKGEDEASVREMFGPTVITFFEQNPGLCMEAKGVWLILWQQGKRTKPEMLRDFVALGQKVIAEFSRPRWRY